jgi:hypothetical protein
LLKFEILWIERREIWSLNIEKLLIGIGQPIRVRSSIIIWKVFGNCSIIWSVAKSEIFWIEILLWCCWSVCERFSVKEGVKLRRTWIILKNDFFSSLVSDFEIRDEWIFEIYWKIFDNSWEIDWEINLIEEFWFNVSWSFKLYVLINSSKIFEDFKLSWYCW